MSASPTSLSRVYYLWYFVLFLVRQQARSNYFFLLPLSTQLGGSCPERINQRVEGVETAVGKCLIPDN